MHRGGIGGRRAEELGHSDRLVYSVEAVGVLVVFSDAVYLLRGVEDFSLDMVVEECRM